MSNTAAIEEALANGWLDQDDLKALKLVPLDARFVSEAMRRDFYGLSLENKCLMIREMIRKPKSP